MGQIAVSVQNISKKYIIGHKKQTSLREAASSFFKTFGRASEEKEEFWALKDVTFDITRGEAVGIIGRNGAGKSTLLKVLSRITEPTTGRFLINGKVSSLLEVGTGFHPELSGRENIFLNGTILGMKRADIRKKFDEIVEFSGVERFLDTPVKRYSSGMYVRLAFSVAAHLDSEILIVDEVLAVGDAEFQSKCLGKMEQVSVGEGKSVLFVSHNMSAIARLCKKGILLNEGRVECYDTADKAITQYNRKVSQKGESVWVNTEKPVNEILLESLWTCNSEGLIKRNFSNLEPVLVKIKFKVFEKCKDVKIGFDLIKNDTVVFRSQQVDFDLISNFEADSSYIFTAHIPQNLLTKGEYFIKPLASIHMIKHLTAIIDPIYSFEIEFDFRNHHYHSILNESNHPGIIFPKLEWTYE